MVSRAALYALWLNDRRRRAEEVRQEIKRLRHDLDTRSADQDRERVSEQRFAKSVELPGHGVARPGRAGAQPGQRARDGARCAVLVPASAARPSAVPEHDGKPEDERALPVRLTAQRLVAELLLRYASLHISANLSGRVISGRVLHRRRASGTVRVCGPRLRPGSDRRV
ncbi:hypothetical protein [Amycolatopsis sp. NPDC051903]|uniref:hypothetical protein n=1 Tax=Amycolatopsis sp. NPDC051903 TaxID=3363936 RepID=UPI0037A96289